MANEDLFNDDAEHGMVRMTFGEHLEDLRRRLVYSLYGVVPGVILGLCVGWYIVDFMKAPVVRALKSYYAEQDRKKAKELEVKRLAGELVGTEPMILELDWTEFRNAVRQVMPELKLPEPPAESPEARPTDSDTAPSDVAEVEHPRVRLNAKVAREEVELLIGPDLLARMRIITLGPQESFMAYMKVSLVAGLVLSSWWIIFQLWQFVAEGLFKHERKIVYRAMPMSVGLFLVGVAFCFFVVLPVVLTFFFGFNAWLDIEPSIRLSEWLGFATILPVIFGICFELPLVMLVLENVGIFKLDVYISKWRHAILIISIIAMVVTPTTDPGSMMLLMGPMAGLYFLGIGLVQMRRGGLSALSPVAKLRAVTGIVVSLYLIGVSIGFAFPPGWLGGEEGWWLETVWRPGTQPISGLLSRYLEDPSKNWLWGVTLGNAALLGLVVLRLGELLLRLTRRDPGTTITPIK